MAKKDVQPMPRIDDILDQLGWTRCFSALNLASGIWQVPLREQDREKTASSVGSDYYEFTNRPFGLTNASATFQRMMGNILKKLNVALLLLTTLSFFPKNERNTNGFSKRIQSYSRCMVKC